jgi:hypothetical protein
LEHFKPLLLVSRIDNVFFSNLFIFYSTITLLLSDILRGVGHNPKNKGKEKGGLKVQVISETHIDTLIFVNISEAKLHDKNFLNYLLLPIHSMIALDRECNLLPVLAKWT